MSPHPNSTTRSPRDAYVATDTAPWTRFLGPRPVASGRSRDDSPGALRSPRPTPRPRPALGGFAGRAPPPPPASEAAESDVVRPARTRGQSPERAPYVDNLPRYHPDKGRARELSCPRCWRPRGPRGPVGRSWPALALGAGGSRRPRSHRGRVSRDRPDGPALVPTAKARVDGRATVLSSRHFYPGLLQYRDRGSSPRWPFAPHLDGQRDWLPPEGPGRPAGERPAGRRSAGLDPRMPRREKTASSRSWVAR